MLFTKCEEDTALVPLVTHTLVVEFSRETVAVAAPAALQKRDVEMQTLNDAFVFDATFSRRDRRGHERTCCCC